LRNDVEVEWDLLNFLTNGRFEYSIEGKTNKKVSGASSILSATERDLTFCSWEGEQALNAIKESNAGIIMCKKQLKGLVQPKKGTQLVFLENPRLSFVSFVNGLQRTIQATKEDTLPQVSQTAIIDKSAKIGTNCIIGNYVVIGENCTIGDNCIIHDRVTLAQNCRLGKHCVIQSGVVLGEDGFAYERHETSELEKFPHFKGVVLEDKVEICAGSNIARGSLTDTAIGVGTKIDALVQVAHNVIVGKYCMLTAATVIGGSATIGDCCWTGLNSTIRDHAKLGNNVIVGAGACVIRDVPDGDIVAGVPAKSIRHKVTGSDVFLMAGQASLKQPD
jgi:UDP-3-O-[3-hydroxymyristoyl] glucosamine N-acyltransferase